MKKTIVLVAMLLFAAASGYAQESRQDVSISATDLIAPTVNGNGVQMDGTGALGALVSYRYMLTPRSALELNYGFTQNVQKYSGLSAGFTNIRIHSRQEEISGAYVYSLNFKNFNPFGELGIGGVVFSPINDFRTNTHDAKQNTNVGLLLGAGLAYEISPSFDIRAEYRVFGMRAPDFGFPQFKTNRIEVVGTPSIGVAYHF